MPTLPSRPPPRLLFSPPVVSLHTDPPQKIRSFLLPEHSPPAFVVSSHGSAQGTNARSRRKIGLAPPIGHWPHLDLHETVGLHLSREPHGASGLHWSAPPRSCARMPVSCSVTVFALFPRRRRSPAGQTATTKLHKTRSAALPKYTIGLNLLWGLLLLLGRRAARKVDRLAVLVLQRAKELPLLTLVLCERLVECA